MQGETVAPMRRDTSRPNKRSRVGEIAAMAQPFGLWCKQVSVRNEALKRDEIYAVRAVFQIACAD